MSQSPRFRAHQFSDNALLSAEEQADLANSLVHFFEQGCHQRDLTASLYEHLQRMFGLTAHGDRRAFAQAWLSRPTSRFYFLEQVLSWPTGPGRPLQGYGEIELSIQEWLGAQNALVSKLQMQARREQLEQLRSIARAALALLPPDERADLVFEFERGTSPCW